MIQTLICLLESVKSVVGRGVNTCLLSGEVSCFTCGKPAPWLFVVVVVV